MPIRLHRRTGLRQAGSFGGHDDAMIISVFRRRLKEGMTFDDFKAAWEADKGFGVPTRVFNAINLADGDEVLSIGFVDIDAETLAALPQDVESQEAVRHSRIDDVIASTELRAFYELATEHDFTDEPTEIEPGSAASLLAKLTG